MTQMLNRNGADPGIGTVVKFKLEIKLILIQDILEKFTLHFNVVESPRVKIFYEQTPRAQWVRTLVCRPRRHGFDYH